MKGKTILVLLLIPVLFSCKSEKKGETRIAVAKAGNTVLYYDQIPGTSFNGMAPEDSAAFIQNYINTWSKRIMLYMKAEENLSADFKNQIENQLRDIRTNLVIYQYQRQMMLQKMDTLISEDEMESYYASNEKKFSLSSNIVKALFIKVPSESPSMERIRYLSRSVDQKDLQQLESLCFQFAEKFDDFGEDWVSMDQLCVELPQDIPNQEDFLRYNTYFETRDSSSVYLITFRDYRLRYSLAPYEYVRNDIKNIILNNRRFDFLQELENDIYSEGIKSNMLKQF